MVLALLKAHYPGVDLHELVTMNPPGLELVMFFEAVKNDTKFIAAAWDLDNIIEQGSSAVCICMYAACCVKLEYYAFVVHVSHFSYLCILQNPFPLA